MNEEQIKEAIDKISKPAQELLRDADPLWARLNPTPFDWMTSVERKRLHELKMMLPSFGKQQQDAKQRIKQKIAERKNK